MNTLYDGDTISSNSVISDEANNETENYMNSLKFIVNSDGSLNIGINDLTKLAWYNLTRDPE